MSASENSTAAEGKEDASIKQPPTAWAPFAFPAFTVLWVATVASNVGTWMHDVGAAWLMTELSPSPAIVAGVQAATTLPVFMFAILAGAIADIVDRKRLLIVVNTFMMATAAGLATLVSLELVTPLVLLVFTFLLGTGAAFMAPAWQAIVPALVPRENLSAAIALNSTGINVSRAIGPALAGFLIVSVGLGAPFILNALSFLGIIAALLWWKTPEHAPPKLPPEKVGAAVIAGLRYAWNSTPVQATLIRAAAFFVFASALWAMMPLVAKELLQGGPTLYGVLLASIGAGAVGGAFLLPVIRQKLGADGTVAAGTIGTAAVLAALSLIKDTNVAVIAAAVAGASWIAVLSSLHVSAQTTLPNWVRARGLSIFLTVFFGAMSAGSLIWGQVATYWSIETSLLIAAIGIVLAVPLTWRAKLQQGASPDLSPSMHWPVPIIDNEETDRAGPVMIQVTYQVDNAQQPGFIRLMDDLAHARRRNGGYAWTLMQDAADKQTFIETWFEASWVDHLRHHERVTKADQELQERLSALTQGNEKPKVCHYLSTMADAPPKNSVDGTQPSDTSPRSAP
ncbi:MAG: MFS transporter [Filomicrobium sp.]